ncbi:hypothetical protein OB905_03255 [Halobacteria archaeon AArc-dxtr1]|nr:hypothetical protein [Halobacteria archaeon AArc-dxtr1]
MTTRPQLRLGRHLLPGVLAIALFGVMALAVLNTEFGEIAGYPDVGITSALGYAMFDLGPLQAEQGVPGTEPFLVAFLLVAVLLDAALDAALVLAKREDGGEAVSPLSLRFDEPTDGVAATDGGQSTANTSAGTADTGPADDTRATGGDHK